jgi:hypothetical protein
MKFSGIHVIPDSSNKCILYGVRTKGDTAKKSQLIHVEHNGNSIIWKAQGFDFNLALFKDEFICGFAISDTLAHLWYLTTNKGNFYFSENAGKNWLRSSFFIAPILINGKGVSIYPSKTNPNLVYCAGKARTVHSIYYSQNKGRDWKSFKNRLGSKEVYDIAGNGNDSLIFTATIDGPFVYDLASDQWYSMFADSSVNSIFSSVEYVPTKNTVRFGTYGRGIWDFEIAQKMKDTTIGFMDLNSNTNTLIVYPNPSSQQIVIKNLNNETEYMIIDSHGRLIQIGMIDSNKKINITSLPTGVYLLKLNNRETTEFLRFTKSD